MNAGPALCDICNESAYPREWLRCMLCGGRYHFSPGGTLAQRDCGVVLPNPASKDGC